MTMLIQLKDGVPFGYAVTEENFKMLFPNTSFSTILTAESVEPYGFGLYEFSSQPRPGKYEKVEEVISVKNASGIWIQSWAVAAMSQDEKAQADADKANQSRAERNVKLSSCDWTQLPDAPVDTAAWAAYRQALRDITSQAGFPWTVTWPEQP